MTGDQHMRERQAKLRVAVEATRSTVAAARLAVEEEVSDQEAMARLVSASGRGAHAVYALAVEVAGRLREDPEDVAGHLFDLAGELLPDTPGAVRAVLQRCVRERLETRFEEEDGKYDSNRTHDEPTARLAVEKLLAWSTYWWCEWSVALGRSHRALYLVAHNMHDVILACYDRDRVVDAVLDLAMELQPNTPGGAWDEWWVADSYRRVAAWLEARGLSDTLPEDEVEQYAAMVEEGIAARDRAAVRGAFRAWCRAASLAAKMGA